MTSQSCCLISHSLQKGVGPADANLLLAAELTRRGYRVSLCGLNDDGASQLRTEEADVDGMEIHALRIPKSLNWETRCKAFRGFLDEQQVSSAIIRFIPYSLNPKGIVWNAAQHLPKTLQAREVIWLMDEIWLDERTRNPKHRLTGALQRFAILRLLRRSPRRRVYTNNHFNAKTLQRFGIDAEPLRLFGNIPVAPADNGEWLYREFEKAGVPIAPANRGEWLILGNFGVFHSDWKPDAFFSALKDRARQHGTRVCMVGIGSLRSYEDHWRNVSDSWNEHFHFLHLGCRTEAEVSRFLQSVDFGLTSNPYYLVGKSGTCMAMLDHGLPILVPRISDQDEPAEFPASLVLRCGNRVEDDIFAPRPSRQPAPQLPEFASQLIAAMTAPS